MFTFYRKVTMLWNIVDVYYPAITFWCWLNIHILPQINYFLKHCCCILPYVHFLVLMKCTLFTVINYFPKHCWCILPWVHLCIWNVHFLPQNNYIWNIADVCYPTLTFWCWWNVHFLLQFTYFLKHCWSKVPYVNCFVLIKHSHFTIS